ncbi:MAG: hypothetical protein GY934_06425 [Gammaproteobacteria bacterium]|nr:hypothetical protein [Gammaproteobacteria bacterium]
MTDNHDLHDEHISKLYRAGSKGEPPKHIDQKITLAAHKAIPRRKRHFAWPSLATAAVLVLSISVVLKVLDQEPLEQSILEPSPNSQSSGSDLKPDKELEQRPTAPVFEPAEERAAAPTASMLDEEAGPPAKPLIPPQEFYKAPAADFPASREDDTVGAAGLVVPPGRGDRLLRQKKSHMHKELKRQQLQLKQKAMAPPDMLEKLECAEIQLPQIDSVAEWQRQYRSAMQQGLDKTAACIKQGFYTKFGKALPKPPGE